MKSYLHSTALFLICVLTSISVLAECPEGKSEVLLTTPSGKTNTMCVSDTAILRIENAAEHSDRVMIAPECPCLDVWDGEPYPAGTDYIGTASPLPETLGADDCQETLGSDDAAITALSDGARGLTRYIVIARGNDEAEEDECAVKAIYTPAYARLITANGALFPDETKADGVINDPGLQACKDLLAARGCDFGG
jgi:hypothetical protein